MTAAKTHILHALLLAAAIFIVYRPALNYGFIWDDNLYVVHNTAVHSWSHAIDAFTSPAATWSSNSAHNISAWRPLRNISYLIDHSLYGLNPTGYHLTNIILHAVAAILLYFLVVNLMRLTTGRIAESTLSTHEPTCANAGLVALIAAAIWALHPVQTEVVAWIKSRDDLLGACFFFGALLMALPKRKNLTQSRKDIKEMEENGRTFPPTFLASTVAVLLFICALLSKENTIILAGLYPIILIIISLRSSRLCVRHFLFDRLLTFSRSRILTFSFLLISLGYLVLRHFILGRTAQAPYPGDGPLQTILTMLHALARYAQLILWPWPPTTQSADYDSYPIITNPLNPGALTGLAILLLMLFALLSFAFSSRPSRLSVKNSRFAIPPIGSAVSPLAAIGIAVILIAILPYANIIPMMQIMAERFLYLPLAGVAIVFASCFSCFAFPSRLRAFASKFLAFIFIAALAFQTHQRLPVWQSELTLFRATRQANPTSWRPADHYVKALLKDNQTTRALTIANQNLHKWPRDPDIIRTAALAHLLNNHETTGTILTNYATKLQPNDPRASQTLAKWRELK